LKSRDVDPVSRILIFIHPGSRIQQQQLNQRGGGKKLFYIFVATNISKLKFIYFILEKNWANLQRIVVLLTQKIVIKLSKIWVWVPGPFLDSGSKGQKATRSRILIRNTETNNQCVPCVTCCRHESTGWQR
jgi:hypothetical protein